MLKLIQGIKRTLFKKVILFIDVNSVPLSQATKINTNRQRHLCKLIRGY